MLPQPNYRGAYAARLYKQECCVAAKKNRRWNGGSISESRIEYSGFND